MAPIHNHIVYSVFPSIGNYKFIVTLTQSPEHGILMLIYYEFILFVPITTCRRGSVYRKLYLHFLHIIAFRNSTLTYFILVVMPIDAEYCWTSLILRSLT